MSEWISVKDRLPEPETEVLILAERTCTYTNTNTKTTHVIITTAMHEDGKISIDDSEWGWYNLDFTHDEESDIYYIPEGWWECCYYNRDDVYNGCVYDTVTHWMPLPEPPKEAHANGRFDR